MDGFGDDEGGGEGAGGRGVAGGGGFEADHGALHALAGGEAEELGVEGDLVGFGAGEEGFDRGRGRRRRPRWRGAGWR